MNTKLMTKIAVPLLILIIIGALWMAKNGGEKAVNTEEETLFSLHATGLDLDELKTHNLPILLDFSSKTCPPCKAMEPDLEAINKEMQDKAIVKIIDVSVYPELASGLPIQVTPTQLLFTDQGNPYVPSEDIPLDFKMYSSKETGDHIYTVHEGTLSQDDMRMILEDMTEGN